jgi:hypothetical protein
MPQGYGFGEIFIQAEGTGDGSRYLRDFQRMGEPGSVMIPFRGYKNLSLMHESPEGLAMGDSITIPLVLGAHVAFFAEFTPAFALGAFLSEWTQRGAFKSFCHLSYGHRFT